MTKTERERIDKEMKDCYWKICGKINSDAWDKIRPILKECHKKVMGVKNVK